MKTWKVTRHFNGISIEILLDDVEIEAFKRIVARSNPVDMQKMTIGTIDSWIEAMDEIEKESESIRRKRYQSNINTS